MSKYGKYILIPANIFLFMAIAFLVIALFEKRSDGEAYIGEFDSGSFNENWKLNEKEEQQVISLPVVLQSQKGTTIVLENILPSYVDDGMRLCMRTALQDIYFYIDGELRGCYAGENLVHVGEYLPSAYVMVDLKAEDAGKPICIQVTIKAQAKLNGITIGYGNNVWFGLLRNNLPVVIAACMLVIIGFFAVIAYLIVKKIVISGKSVLFLGQAMLAIGFWIISESNIRQLIFQSPSYSTFFSYMFMELIAGFVALYFDEIQHYKYHKAYIIIELLVFGQVAVNTFLALTGISEFYNTLTFSHIWMLAGVITFIITVIVDIKTKRIRNYSITAFGMLVFILFCFLEILGFYIRDFYILGKYLCVGLVVLLVTTVCQTVKDEMKKIKLTAELERAKIEAEKANIAKTKFLAEISHEIRTPINAVLGMNEMILRESKEAHIRGYASDVKDSSLILLNIVNEILDSSKIESGMMEIVEGNYEISNLLNDIYNIVSIKAKEKNLKLVFDIDTAMPKEYMGDDKRIKQILLNLLTNAVKYTNQGMVILKVGCRIKDENAILHYSVKDTGIGIKPENIGSINDAFQRFDMSRNRNVEGTGLGMSITQQLLKLMGSGLQIQSEYGKGSEFSFDIEQKIVNVEPLGDFREKSRSISQKSFRTAYIAPQAKILVVDDSEMNLKVFRSLLVQTKMQIVEAESGRRCLDKLKEQKFDLIFLDHMMPDMDGIETLHAIKGQRLCEGVPIVMLTANAIVGDREKYINEGFDDFLSKPIIPNRLDELILQYLPKAFVTIEVKDGQNNAIEEQKKFQLPELNELQRKLPEINFEVGLATSSGDEKFYLELLQDFILLPIKEELTNYTNESNYKNYHIRIHGFKNSAYFIGANQLGDLALKIEECTKDGLPEEIKTMQNHLFEQFDKICLRYKEVVLPREGESFL